MKWSDLSMAERAHIIALGVQSGITNLNDIRKGYNSFARGGYTKWKEKIREHKDIDIDNDPTYDYEGFYNSDPDRAWDMMNKDSNAHFTDKYKTVYHPSFSNQSIYSGHINKFNPKGIVGGTWIDDNNYQLSQSQFDSDWDTDATLDYFDKAENSPVNLYAPDGATVLKGITVTPNKFGRGGVKKYRIGKLNNEGKPVIDYSIPAFSSEQEIDSYMKNNNLQQIFVENLPELVVKHPDLIAKEQAQEANWTDKDKERYARMMESTGWRSGTDFADKVIAAEQRARNVSQGAVLGQLSSGLNVLSPSQQFGAIVDWAQGEKGYWEGNRVNNKYVEGGELNNPSTDTIYHLPQEHLNISDYYISNPERQIISPLPPMLESSSKWHDSKTPRRINGDRNADIRHRPTPIRASRRPKSKDNTDTVAVASDTSRVIELAKAFADTASVPKITKEQIEYGRKRREGRRQEYIDSYITPIKKLSQAVEALSSVYTLGAGASKLGWLARVPKAEKFFTSPVGWNMSQYSGLGADLTQLTISGYEGNTADVIDNSIESGLEGLGLIGYSDLFRHGKIGVALDNVFDTMPYLQSIYDLTKDWAYPNLGTTIVGK